MEPGRIQQLANQAQSSATQLVGGLVQGSRNTVRALEVSNQRRLDEAYQVVINEEFDDYFTRWRDTSIESTPLKKFTFTVAPLVTWAVLGWTLFSYALPVSSMGLTSAISTASLCGFAAAFVVFIALILLWGFRPDPKNCYSSEEKQEFIESTAVQTYLRSSLPSKDAGLGELVALNEVRRNPRNKQLRFRLCLSLMENGKHDVALAHLDRFLLIRPDDIAARGIKAEVLTRMKYYSQALTILNELAALRPNNAFIQSNRLRVIALAGSRPELNIEVRASAA
jgi:tetratricopeptide (TPR) repeat protein